LITVIGGEDYAFGDFSLRVIPNIHSALDHKQYYNNGRGIAGVAPRGLRAPLRRKDYVEGGNMAYLLRMAGHEVLIMGSMNYIEREMEGLRPDIALVGANSQRLEIYDYTGRLMRLLGKPALVIPSHADAYGNPSPTAAMIADRKLFEKEVFAASPKSRFISPAWFEPIIVPARRGSPHPYIPCLNLFLLSHERSACTRAAVLSHRSLASCSLAVHTPVVARSSTRLALPRWCLPTRSPFAMAIWCLSRV